MATEKETGKTNATDVDIKPAQAKEAEKKRDIKGGLPYTTAAGSFKKALDGIIVAERPEKFSGDFLTTVLKISGGSGRQVPPLLKKMAFLTSDGTPTDLYSKFKSDTARGQAALDGLRNAYSEMFRRNDFIHKADEAVVKDLVVEITGLKKNDPIVRLMTTTFEAIRGFADKSGTPSSDETTIGVKSEEFSDFSQTRFSGGQSLGLSYHINIVLPETENIAVFNAIFRSIRENLL